MTPADWKSALLTLADGPFFDLMRTYLGDIKTPFNKQRLVGELEAFLGRREIQETIRFYLDATDAALVAALEELGEPTADELALFFEGELPFAELHAVLLNLEERLIIFRFDDGSSRRLALNPILAPVLEPLIADPSLLFPSFLRGDTGPANPGDLPRDRGGTQADDLFLVSVIAYLRRLPDLFRADGEYRKRAADEATRIFPFASFASVVDAFHALGLVLGEDEGVRIDETRLSAFSALSPQDRRWFLAAGSCGASLERTERRGVGRVARDRLVLWARLFRSLAGRLDPGRDYPAVTIHRLMEVSLRELSATRRRRWDTRDSDPGAEVRGGAEAFTFRTAAMKALETAGILETVAEGRYRLSPEGGVGDGASPLLVVDSAFSVLVPPELPFDDAVQLTQFVDIRETGRVARFELTRESTVRGFDRGLSPVEIIAFLERLSGRQVPQNVAWSIKDWYGRYSAVAVYRGVVLTLAEDRRFILETDQVSRLLRRELAPGVYLLNVENEEEALRALAGAGCDIVAQPPQGAGSVPGQRNGEAELSRFSPFGDLGRPGTDLGRPSKKSAPREGTAPGAGENYPAAERRAALRSALEGKNLPKDQQDELAARVDRRVILVESQLVGAAVRYEKLEAKGLDYVGKVRVAEQALATQSLVELFWRGPRGEPNRALGSPVSLDKSGGEVELSLDPVPRGERIRIAVGKISLIRRVKRSIFGE